MSKISAEVWEEAKILFLAGESLRTIEEKTGIDHSMISKKSKKEKWREDDAFIALKKQAMLASKCLLEFTMLAIFKRKKLAEESKNGLYVKNIVNGESVYAPIDEGLTDIAKVIPLLKGILELEHTQVNIQNNFNKDSDLQSTSQVQIYIPNNNRDTLEVK